MVKDRLGALKEILNDDYDTDNDISINMEASASFMPNFFKEVEVISQSLDKIVATVEEVKKKHSFILSAPSTDEKVKQTLEDLMAEIKKLSSKVTQKLKMMNQSIEKKERGPNLTSADIRMKKTQHSALSRRFVSVMIAYNDIQVEYRGRCKDRIKRQLEITGHSKTNEEIEEMLESGNPAIFTQGIVIETQKARRSLAEIEDRHADIIKLEKSIKELHDMYVDMAVLIETQGELIDRIEDNVKNATDYVGSGTKSINQAIRYQRKARKKIIILVIVVILILLILGLIIGFSVSK